MDAHRYANGKPVTVTMLGTADAFGSGGRAQAGYLVQSGGKNFMLEAGPGLVGALKKSGISPAALDFVIISHLHGDHFAGLAFLILDYMYESPLRKTVTIAGPPKLEQRTRALMRAMFPRVDVQTVRRRIKFMVLEPGRRARLGRVARLGAIRSPHTAPDISLSIKLETGGKTIVFSGDTGWNEELVTFSDGADLMICECTYYAPDHSQSHINYAQLKSNRGRFRVGRMLLTHLGSEMLGHGSDIDMQMAFDGMRIEV